MALALYGKLPYISTNKELMRPHMTRTARLETRLPPEVHDLLKRAAEIQGRSVSDFVVTAAQDAARKVISEIELIQLTRDGQERFAALIVAPPAPTPALRKAFKAHRKLVAG
jgi:uncharacterized protein (DUF1778 family)